MNPYYNNPQGISLSEGYQQLGSYEPPTAKDIGSRMKDLKKANKRNNPWLANNATAIGGAALEGVAGGIDMFNNIQGSINEYRDMKIINPETEVNGVPTYAGVSNVQSQYESINRDDAGKGLVAQGAMTGAKAGMGLMAINPVVGGIAAGVGALVGGIAGAFGKNKAKKEADKAKQEAKDRFMAGQQSYNEDVEDYYGGVDAKRADIQGERNYQSRLYGLNQFRDPFRSIV